MGLKGKKMKKLEINYVGGYRQNNNYRHREPYWASRVTINGTTRCVADAAGVDETGENVVRLLPYGPANVDLVAVVVPAVPDAVGGADDFARDRRGLAHAGHEPPLQFRPLLLLFFRHCSFPFFGPISPLEQRV